MPFTGFPSDAVPFLTELAAHNDVVWFEANRHRYTSGLLEPARAFVEALGPALHAIDPELRFEAKVNGSIFQIRRDTRFSADKTPYKTELGVRFWHGPDRKACVSSLYMRICPTFVGLGAGVWAFTPEALARYREAVASDETGGAIAAAIAGVEVNGCSFQHDAYRRVPAPWPQDHPREELLRQRGLAAGVDVPVPSCLGDASFVDFCANQFGRLAPVHHWLVGHAAA